MYSIFEALLRNKGVTVSEISRATGISTSTFSDWKAGRYTPKEDKIKKLAAYFDVPVSYFYGGENGEPPRYYLNEETAAMAQKLFDDPNLRMLFDAAQDCPPDQLQLAARMLQIFKGSNPDG